VTGVPRTVQEIISQADNLTNRFEKMGLSDDNAALREARALREVRQAFRDVARAQQVVAERVAVARAEGHSWMAIGMMLGTSGEAARQRYGRLPDEPPRDDDPVPA
jgi:hypothetical protein